MSCMLCGSNCINGDRVAKIVRAVIDGDTEGLRYSGDGDEGIVHIDCLEEVMSYYNKSIPAIHDSPIERNNILEFLDK